MEYALGILGTVVAGLIWWALNHSHQCADFHERMARMEERLGMKE